MRPACRNSRTIVELELSAPVKLILGYLRLPAVDRNFVFRTVLLPLSVLHHSCSRCFGDYNAATIEDRPLCHCYCFHLPSFRLSVRFTTSRVTKSNRASTTTLCSSPLSASSLLILQRLEQGCPLVCPSIHALNLLPAAAAHRPKSGELGHYPRL